MLSILRKIALFCLLLLCIALSQRHVPIGVLGLRQDWLTFFDDAAYVSAARELSHAWIPYGTGTPIFLPSIWSYVLFLGALASAHVNPATISHIEVILPLAGALWGFFLLARSLHCSIAASAIGAALYAGGPVLFNKIGAGHIPYAIGYALFPVTLAFFIRATHNDGRRSLFFLSLSAIFAMLSSNGAQFIFLLPLTLFFMSLFIGRRVRALAYGFIVSAGIAFFQLASVAGAIFGKSQLSGDVTAFPIAWIRFNSVGYPNALILSGYGPAYWQQALKVISLNNDVLIAAYGLLFALLSLSILHRRRTTVVALLSIFLLGTLVLAGATQSVVAQLLKDVFINVPAAVIFKELYNVAVVPALAFALCVTFGIDASEQVGEPIIARGIAFIPLAIFIALLANFDASFDRQMLIVSAFFLVILIALIRFLRGPLKYALVAFSATLASVVYTYPTFASGTFGGQLQAVATPVRALKDAYILSKIQPWHRTLFWPAVEPLTIGKHLYGGLEPFSHGPGYPVNVSYPQGIYAASLSGIAFDHPSAIAPLLRRMGVQFVVNRGNFRSLFLRYEPNSESLEPIWNNPRSVDQLRSYFRAARIPRLSEMTVDLGIPHYVRAWAAWAPAPMSPIELGRFLEAEPNILALNSTQHPLPSSYMAAIPDAAYLGNNISMPLFTRSLSINPEDGWVATTTRWFEDAALAGLPGVYTSSAKTLAVHFSLHRPLIDHINMAILGWRYGGLLRVNLDGTLLGLVSTNYDDTKVRWISFPARHLKVGVHTLTITPSLGGGERNAVVALISNAQFFKALPKVSLETLEQRILRGESTGPPLRISLNNWIYQSLLVKSRSFHRLTALDINTTGEEFLLHHPLNLRPGHYIIETNQHRYAGIPMRLAVWSNELKMDVARRVLPPEKQTALTALDVTPKDGPLTLFLYGNALTHSLHTRIRSLVIQQVRPLPRQMGRPIASAPSPLACNGGESTTITCAYTTPAHRLFVDLEETYSPDWRLCVKSIGSPRPCIEVPRRFHYVGNGYDNAWEVRAPGGNLKLVFKYAPDSWYFWAYRLQFVAVAIAVLLSILSIPKRAPHQS